MSWFIKDLFEYLTSIKIGGNIKKGYLIKMRTELPECKRCCFCLPLRYGLITWGYIKLIAGALLSIAIAISLFKIIAMSIKYGNTGHLVENIVILSIVLVMLLTDVALNTVFVVGGHMKNVKLLRVYYIYNMVLLGLTIALVLVMFFLMVPTVLPNHILSFSTWLLVLDFSGSFVNIVMQTYFLLLVRSEIIKLQNNCEFQFVNNAAEAECTMKYKEGLVDEEKGTEDVCSKGTCETEDVCEIKCQSNGTCHKIVNEN